MRRRTPRVSCVVFVTVLSAVGVVNLAAQDRVILFEPLRFEIGSPFPLPFGEIREVEVTQGGRGLAVRRVVPIPAHMISGRPVATADGAHMVWLAFEGPAPYAPTVLAHYDATTGRAAVIDSGHFEPGAFLVTDPHTVRIFIIESRRIVSVDASLALREYELTGSKVTVRESATVAAGRLFVVRRAAGFQPQNEEFELLVLNIESGSVEQIVPLSTGAVNVRPDGQSFYQVLRDISSTCTIELVAIDIGTVLARRPPRECGSEFLFFDERRGVVVFLEREAGQQRLSAYAGDTLAPLGAFAPSVFADRRDFWISETPTERPVMVYSRLIGPGYFNDCQHEAPRVDVFDGPTLTLLYQIDLEGRCPLIVPLPAPASGL